MNPKLRSFVLYDERGVVIPMSLLRRKYFPKIPNVTPLEVNSTLCCSGELPTIEEGATSKGLKAWVQFGSNGFALAGPVIRRASPGKGWRQIQYTLCCSTSLTFPVITEQPENVSVTEPDAAVFSVVATGNGLTYQWKRNTVDIPGATESTYIIDPTSVSDDGDLFSVTVTNTVGSVASNDVSLTVTA